MAGTEDNTVERRGAMARLRDPGTWRGLAAIAALGILTVAVAATYAVEPQSPRDLLDRLTLLVEREAYGPLLRHAERTRLRAERAEVAGEDSLAAALRWEAARTFERAGAVAPGPGEEMAANDQVADAYLALGWRYLERGRGGRFGIGRRHEALEAAERMAACVVGVAPTRRRSEINAFVQALEDVLERPLSGRCPR
ncbi:MAG: hypothetical protein AMS25_14470 [Gemmatimonas sp. SM23_52]|nr:MAG: hypothetical protein AMS25_14470 [Gemmatimonas sp. SM23_52]